MLTTKAVRPTEKPRTYPYIGHYENDEVSYCVLFYAPTYGVVIHVIKNKNQDPFCEVGFAHDGVSHAKFDYVSGNFIEELFKVYEGKITLENT